MWGYDTEIPRFMGKKSVYDGKEIQDIMIKQGWIIAKQPRDRRTAWMDLMMENVEI